MHCRALPFILFTEVKDVDSRLRKQNAFFICIFLFLIGGAAGAFTGRAAGEETASLIWTYCSDQKSPVYALLFNFALPCAILFFSTSVIGFLFIPPVDMLGGFLTGYLMTLCFSAAGRSLYTAAYLAVPAFLGTTCFLFLSSACMDISCFIGRERRGTAEQSGAGRIMAAMAGLAVLTAAEIIFYHFTA